MLIPAFDANSDILGRVSMSRHSQIANRDASPVFRKTGNAYSEPISQYADMVDDDDKNGGPNHLRAWRRFRRLKGAELAKLLDITPGMVSDLENSNRALSAKWLRRIAPCLSTTPGMLLDHDPNDLDQDMIDLWVNADPREKKQITGAALAIIKTGTSE